MPLAAVARIDPVEYGELVAGRHPVALGEVAVGDLVGELCGDLHEERGRVVEHVTSLAPDGPSVQWFIS